MNITELLAWLNENSGATTVILTGIYVLATIIIVIYNRKTIKEMRLAREQQINPVILLSFEIRQQGLLCLIVRNLGGTPAKDLRIDICDEWINLLKQKTFQERFQKLKTASLTIVPKQELIYGIGGTADFSRVSETQIKGFIKYKNIFNKKFEDEFLIDIDSYSGILVHGPEIDELNSTVKRGLIGIQKEINYLGRDIKRSFEDGDKSKKFIYYCPYHKRKRQ